LFTTLLWGFLQFASAVKCGAHFMDFSVSTGICGRRYALESLAILIIGVQRR
jgi:hypothetical protein